MSFEILLVLVFLLAVRMLPVWTVSNTQLFAATPLDAVK